jgi:thiamine-phosphate pyrophosphorylase
MATDLYLIAPPDAESAAFAQTLGAVLAGTAVAALLLPRGERTESAYCAFVADIASMAQHSGCAVLTDAGPRLTLALGLDGIHVEGSAADLESALAALKPDRIVGTGGIVSRHEAMTLGELGLDYIMFGPFSGAIAPEIRELAGWWAETMEIPSVLSDPAATPETVDPCGCEFFAVGDSIWRSPDPAAAIAAIAARLEELA